MSDIKLKLEKATIEAWDWDEMLGVYFPQWFHEFADNELQNSDVSYGSNSATVFPGHEAVQVLESAYFNTLMSNFSSEQYAEVKAAISKVTADLDLSNRDARVVVWS